MNCYAGLAKRLVKSCFPPEVPVPQLQPLDSRNIIKQEVQLISTNKACFALSDAHERVNKPKTLSDEDAWEATLAWAEAKAQEREAAATKALSQTDTDESYDSDESELGVSIQPLDRRAKSALFAGSESDNSDWEDLFVPTTAARHPALQGKLGNLNFMMPGAAPPSIAKKRYAAWVADVMIGVRTKAAAARAVEEKRAARTIQTAARGRAVRAWNPFVSAPTVSHIDTDDSYDSDDFALAVPAPPPKPKLPAGAAASGPLAAMAGLMRVGEVVRAKVYSLDDAAAAAAMWRDDVQADAYECVAAKKALEALDKWLPSPRKYTAATIIQAAERGRVVRVGVAALAAVWTEWTVERRACGERAVTKAATIIQAAARGRAVRAWNVFRPAPTIYDSPAAWYREAYRATFKLNGTLRRPLTPPRRRRYGHNF